MPSINRMRIKTELLPDGISLRYAVHDDQNQLLVPANSPITVEIRQDLLARGIEWVVLNQADALEVMGLGEDAPKAPAEPRKETPSRPLPPLGRINAKINALENTVSLSVENSGPPLKQQVEFKGNVPYNVERNNELTKQFVSAKKLLDELVREAMAGTARDSQALDFVVAKYVEGLIGDTDLVISASDRAAPNPMLTERSIRTAIMAMALAIEIGYDEQHVREIGLCGLVQDWGMLHLPEHLQDPTMPITKRDWETFQCHPLYTAELLSSIDGVSREVRLAATQGYENPDGSGYPRGLKGKKIHPYATILQVVNIYLSLTTPMRGRQAYVAYDVMVYMLHQVKSGRISERGMRALINVVSLFPIGSHVRLVDGSEAMVIRRNQRRYTTPYVQAVGGDRKFRIDAPEQIIINSAEAAKRVMMALPSPDREEIRIEEDSLEVVLWSGINA